MSEQEVDKKPDELDEYEQSAAMFNHLAKVFRKQVYKLAERKKRAPARVLEAFLFRPLEEVELIGKEEKNLFDLCSTIMYHKIKIVEYAQQKEKNKGVENGEQKE